MTDRRMFTDRFLKALRPAPRGQRVEYFDARVPGFGIRISDSKSADPARRGKAGRVVFMLFARFSAGTAPTRRTIGTFPAITLEKARRTACAWRDMIDKGIDPQVIEAEAKAKAARERAISIQHSFGSAAENFITDKLAHERRGKIAERDFRHFFVTAWADRPLGDITALDVLEVVNRKKRTAPGMARSLLVIIRRFFAWVVSQHIYGLDRSPCDKLHIDKIIGPSQSRSRRLTDAELFALWRTTGKMKHPVGSLYRLLALTGLRLNEAAHLSWPEIHGDSIIIPAKRMKGRNGAAVEHLVPLSEMAQAVIASVPRYRSAAYLFSFSAGRKPLAMTGAIKRDVDVRMLQTLKAMARKRGDDPNAVELPRWTTHDLRRVVRSGLSELRVPHVVAESVLAHRQGGIAATYDLHQYEDEKREALGQWARKLSAIVNPATPAKVIPLRRQRR